MALRDAVGQWHHLFDEQSDIVWNDVAMDNFFSSLNAERFGKKIERSRARAKAGVFDYIECFYDRPGVICTFAISVP